jgi:hypothetical protein
VAKYGLMKASPFAIKFGRYHQYNRLSSSTNFTEATLIAVALQRLWNFRAACLAGNAAHVWQRSLGCA